MPATIESLRAEGLKDEDTAFLRRARKMTGLVEHEGWLELERIAAEWINVRTKALLVSVTQRPADSATDEYLKGVIYGIQLQMTAPQTIIAQARALLEALRPGELAGEAGKGADDE